jgi:hypothetical protein
MVTQLNPSELLCGLVEAHYPSYDYTGMSKAADAHAQSIA